jgi:hypothetical protein
LIERGSHKRDCRQSNAFLALGKLRPYTPFRASAA